MAVLYFFRALLVLAFSTIILYGCSTAKISAEASDKIKTLTPPGEKALVYIVRPSALGALIPLDISCDGKRIGSTSGTRFIYTFLDSGSHKFFCKGENKSELTLNVEAGKIYFAEQKIKLGLVAPGVELALLDEYNGRKKLNLCKLSGDCLACTTVTK